MSRFALLRHTLVPSVVGGGGALTNTATPVLSGAPRQNEVAYVSLGTWSATPSAYRLKQYRDGALIATTNPSDTVNFTWGSADVGTAPSFTVEASSDGGVTWSTPVTVLNSFTFSSDLITPATIPDGVLTRTSASGTLPMTFTIAQEVYYSYKRQIAIWDATLTTQKYFGEQMVAENELNSPFTIDLSGATDPAPSPAMPSLGATDVLFMRYCSPDYVQGSLGLGVCGNWMAISPTNRAGHRFWTVNGTPAAGQGFAFLGKIAFASSGGGSTLISPKNLYSGQPTPWDPDNNGIVNLLDGANNGMAGGPGILNLPGYITVDFGVPVDLHQIGITSLNGQASNALINFTVASSDTVAGTQTTVLTESGLTYASGGQTMVFTW